MVFKVANGARFCIICIPHFHDAVCRHGFKLVVGDVAVEFGIVVLSVSAAEHVIGKLHQFGLHKDVTSQTIREVDVENHVIRAGFVRIIPVFFQQADDVKFIQIEVVGPVRKVVGAQTVGLGAGNFQNLAVIRTFLIGQRVNIEVRIIDFGNRARKNSVIIGLVNKCEIVTGKIDVYNRIAMCFVRFSIKIIAPAFREIDAVVEAGDV
jgi:hypothetical protein